MTTVVQTRRSRRAVATTGAHPGVRATFGASMTLAGRGLLKIRHNPARLFDVIALPVVSTAMFAGIFGGAIAGSVSSYLPQLIPGVLVQIAVTAAVGTGVQLCEDIDKGVFDRFRSLPIARVAPLIGALTADIVRYVVATVMAVSVGLAMGYRPHSWPGLLVGCALVVFTSFALSWVFAYLGVRMSSPAAVQGASMFVLMPMTFISNALVPTTNMPGWIKWLAEINPVSHLVTATRELANHGHAGIDIVWSTLGVVVIMAVMAPVTVRAFIRKG
ncbi:ABC transporter permease [Rudaeicoccus suwonensis]|uniref:Transport permease protein n=1 Tax=Rudaeicoccus suwonensis TaxID=657409 RepID=A0A561DX92_9MICO|nr:ABC transporter permease [Rudaeicoccus suwonensis]TWE07950.1 ABC-2 type transport system permease protein [Rudaeicoccus suwonensis]